MNRTARLLLTIITLLSVALTTGAGCKKKNPPPRKRTVSRPTRTAPHPPVRKVKPAAPAKTGQALPTTQKNDCDRYTTKVCGCSIQKAKFRMLCTVTKNQTKRIRNMPEATRKIMEANCLRALKQFKCL